MTQHKKYGVIPWKQSGMYQRSDVIKEYDREGIAQKYADKLNNDSVEFAKTSNGYVVRETHYMREKES